jgi:hypothetical protein
MCCGIIQAHLCAVSTNGCGRRWVQGLPCICRCPMLAARWGDLPVGQTTSSLTGVWHGLYSYDVVMDPVYFVATLMSGVSWISGTSHEATHGQEGLPLTLFASLNGNRTDIQIEFTKTYDGTGGWSHAVAYSGTLSPDATEIEGTWAVPQGIGVTFTGRFLMIRSRGTTEAVVRRAFEKA